MVAGLIEQYVNIERDKYNVRGRDMVGESGIRPGEVDSDGNGIPDILEIRNVTANVMMAVNSRFIFGNQADEFCWI